VKYAKGMTVVQAIAAAGGFTPVASARRVTVVRGDAAKKQVLKVNVNDIMSDPDARDVSLQPNDVITVPQRLF
jgi:polysaccharide export outer membrane protein